jgi:glycosyltransferase involved in cell wall biosynthesis
MSLSLIIPTYRNPEYLDVCLRSAIENQANKNEILVCIDGYIEESQYVLDKYKKDIIVLDLEENQGFQTSHNLAVINANNENLCIINDDNVLCKDWDKIIEQDFDPNKVMTIEQIEPVGPSIFGFHIKDFGKNPKEFNYEDFIEYELTIRKNKLTKDGGVFPFVISKKNYMIVGGFDTLYPSPYVCDWDFFLKLDLNGVEFYKTHNMHFYHFGSTVLKKGIDKDRFAASHNPAAETFYYKWGMYPQLFENNSHKPKGFTIKGIKYE